MQAVKMSWLVYMVFSLGAVTARAEEIPVVPAAKARLSEAKLAEIDKFMERQLSDKKLACGIVIISHQGKIGFFQTYGQMDIEAKRAMRKDTIFRLYSMSKAITTAAALTLYDAGKFKLELVGLSLKCKRRRTQLIVDRLVTGDHG